MNINNGQLLSLLFDQPKLVEALNQSIPYVSIFKEKTILNLRCLEISSLSSLLKFRSELTNKLVPFLGYEIHLECKHAIGDAHMVAIAERLIENPEVTGRFLSLETLAKATSTSPTEVKKLLAKAKEVIHPMEDGSEMITENAFDSVVLQWAKSFKDDVGIDGTSVNTFRSTKEIKERKPSTKVLTSELTNEDIIKVRTGKTAGCPNLTSKGIDTTLANFFGKVKLEDTSLVDAVSAFIEGTSEYGQALRKKLTTAYKKFTKDPNLQEVMDELIEGAKDIREKMTTTATQEQ